MVCVTVKQFVMARLVTHLDLFLILRQNGDLKDFVHLFEVILSKIPYQISGSDCNKIKEVMQTFTRALAKRWADASRNIKTFMNRENNRKWLESNIKWPLCDTVDLLEVMGTSDNVFEEPALLPDPIPSVSSATVGTSTEIITRKPFEELSNKQKKRRSASIVDDNSEEELQYCLIHSTSTASSP